MPRWNISARVIDIGVVTMGDNFVAYDGVKVVMPDGQRRFLDKVVMHSEVDSVFRDTQGENVQLHLSGPGGTWPALLYGIKSSTDGAFRREVPFGAARMALWLGLVGSLALSLLLVGIPAVLACLWYLQKLSAYRPPSRAAFEADGNVVIGRRDGIQLQPTVAASR